MGIVGEKANTWRVGLAIEEWLPACGVLLFLILAAIHFSSISLGARLRSPDPEVRKAAIADCGGPGNSRAIRAIAPLLDDPDPAVRICCATKLGELGDRRAIGPLTEDLRHETDSAQVGRDAELLAALGATQAVAALAQRLPRRQSQNAGQRLPGVDAADRDRLAAAIVALEGRNAPSYLVGLYCDGLDVAGAIRGLGRPATGAALVAELRRRHSDKRDDLLVVKDHVPDFIALGASDLVAQSLDKHGDERMARGLLTDYAYAEGIDKAVNRWARAHGYAVWYRPRNLPGANEAP
jgi:hypothetical protein